MLVKNCVICDIDGTIALRGDRGPHDHGSAMEDHVNWPVVKIVTYVYLSSHYPLILLTGREERYRDVTEYWLGTHNIFPFRTNLVMRARGDYRDDAVVKEELYRQHIEPHYRVLCVFDDRDKVVAMWRRLGLPCFQVAPGAF